MASTPHINKTIISHSKKPRIIKILDIASLQSQNPEQAIQSVQLTKPGVEKRCDIFIAGGGIGGIAAALKIISLTKASPQFTKHKLKIIISEETNWLGGQITAQGVPALDENYLVETSGANKSYQEFRNSIRNYYHQNFSLSSPEQSYLNPGNCWVSRLAFEPKIALLELSKLLQSAVDDHSLEILCRHKAFQTNCSKRELKSVDLLNFQTKRTVRIIPRYCLDATELGDIIALAKYEYFTGSDSQAITQELHAPSQGNPRNIQDFTYPFVLEYRHNENHCIEKPRFYEEIKEIKPFSFLGYKMFAPVKADSSQEVLPFWEYRRIIDARTFVDNRFQHDLAIINWESNDVRGKNIIDENPEIQANHLAFGKELSLCFLYWLQKEAPRDDGGFGYPELLLRKDILDTEDGLAKHPYIRESRRIRAKTMIREQDIAANTNHGARARLFSDSVGIGLYPIDIHGYQEVSGAGQEAKPFQIPLGALLPYEDGNILPACKNIGVTHITNGAYRLHPIEWSVGEAQGALALFSLQHRIKPQTIFYDLQKLREFQRLLIQTGVPVYWYDDIPTEHPAFQAIQYLAISEIMVGPRENLHFYPDEPISREEVVLALTKAIWPELANTSPIEILVVKCLSIKLLSLMPDGLFHAEAPLSEEDFNQLRQHSLWNRLSRAKAASATSGSISENSSLRLTKSATRADFAQWLYRTLYLKP